LTGSVSAFLQEVNQVLKIKYFIQQSWLLIVSSFFFGLLIAATNYALSERIEQNKIEKFNRLTAALLAEAKPELAAELEINSLSGKEESVKVYKVMTIIRECIGWSFKASGPGFADKIELVVTVDKGFERIAGFDVLSSNETPGFGDRIKNDYYRDQFKGAPTDILKLVKTGKPEIINSEIVAITGATVSSEAVVKIINNSLLQIKKQMLEKGLINNGK
jgi:electron transport complex protein RnfG